MINVLFQPYPLTFNTRQKVLTAVLAGLFVCLFLLIFQPFGTHSWPNSSKWLIFAGYGLITTVVMFGWEAIHLYYLHRNNEEKWRVWMEMLSIFLLVTAIGAANWLYGCMLGFSDFKISNLWSYMRMTYLIGIFPSVFIPLINYIQKLKRHTIKSEQLNQQIKTGKTRTEKTETSSLIQLVAENEKDTFSCPLKSLYSISSTDNYASIMFYEPETASLRKHLIRSSLHRLEAQLKQEQVMRCHRSHIVNLRQVEKTSGNAQGYQLHFPLDHPPVPVSRKYATEVLKWLENNK